VCGFAHEMRNEMHLTKQTSLLELVGCISYSPLWLRSQRREQKRQGAQTP
jgi:hypothetical protein